MIPILLKSAISLLPFNSNLISQNSATFMLSTCISGNYCNKHKHHPS